jgi:RES domain-containing protein
MESIADEGLAHQQAAPRCNCVLRGRLAHCFGAMERGRSAGGIHVSLALSRGGGSVRQPGRCGRPRDFVSIEATLPVTEEDVVRIELAKLPADWRGVGQAELQRIGRDWVTSGRSLALLVPSAAVDGEWNALVNPAHPLARGIVLGTPKAFRFDPRMFRGKG